MSETKWTASQQSAIRSTDGAVLVSAAAGSGKTTVLVERIVSIITDEKKPTPADRFLAVTFTNAAAANVAARLRAALEKRISLDPANRFLRRQNLLLKRASISTVHAFCSSLLKEYFSLLEIPPDFSICDELTASTIKAAAIEETLSEMYADENGKIKELSELFGRSRSDRDTSELILKLFDFETNLAFPERWEKECIDELKSKKAITESRMGEMLFSFANDALPSAKDFAVEALSVCSDDEELDGYAAAITGDLDEINRLSALASAKNWNGIKNELDGFAHKSLSGGRNANEELKSLAKALREEIKDVFKKLKGSVFICSQEEYISECAETLNAVEILFGANRLFSERLFNEKLRRRVFEFSDLERLTLRLLCREDGSPSELSDEIAARFDFILVDEYQDTNEIQDLIFKLVSREEKNLFFVGDVKQSIYSFRRAEPEIFVRRREMCYPDEAGLYPKRIMLSENFRSSSSVIDAVNAVFRPIMTKKAGGTNYDDGEELIPFSGSSRFEKTGLELHIARAQEKDDEPKYVASLISQMINDGYEIEENGVSRPCNAGDFCVLLRSPRNKANAFREALDERGVRAWTDTSDNFFLNSEIAVAMSLLQIIDNPRRDLALISVMLSPLFGFSEDELLSLRSRDKTAPFYSLVLTSEEEKFKSFAKTITALQNGAKALGLGETVRLALDETDAEVLLTAGSEIEKRQNNLRLLVDYANSFQNGTKVSLSQFLAVCQRAIKQGKSPVSDVFSPPSDAVSIISVHKAKGLEWNIVILADSDKRFNFQDSSDSPLLFSTSLYAGLRRKLVLDDGISFYTKRTLGYSALALSSAQSTRSEEMRVLYVALTRAKQKVIVTAALEKPEERIEKLFSKASREKIDPFIVNSLSDYLSWILLSLLNQYPEKMALAVKTGEALCDFIKVVIGRKYEKAQTVIGESADEKPDQRLLAQIEQRLSFTYKNAALSAVPTKLSVSDISKKGDSSPIYTPVFSRKAASGAEKGTTIHLFMQLADYAAAAKSVDDELARLVENEYLDPISAKEISKTRLEAFFKSELGQRVVSAKKCLREYAFIDTISARDILSLPDGVDAPVLVQGIADCILIEENGATLIDYKSDRVERPEQLIERYKSQLLLYERTLKKQLNVPIKEVVIYSFHLEKAIKL